MAFQRGKSRAPQGRGGRAPLEYVLTGTTYREVNGEKVEDPHEEWQLAITVPVENQRGDAPLETLIAKLQEILDTNGELGARLVFYVSPRENKNTGEEFAATNILVQPKMEKKPEGGRGGFKSNRNQGRRSYPPAQAREEEEEEQAPPPVRRPAAAPAAKGPVKAPIKKKAEEAPPEPPEEGWTEDNIPL